VNDSAASRLSRFDPRVNELIARMTLEEKIGQMCQQNLGGAPSPEQRQAIAEGRVGSFLNARKEDRNELQRIAVEESRLGIPLIFGRDVIHGFRTIFPIPLAQASSFDPELVERAAEVAAREAASQGVDWTFAPMVDVTREPRWGRVAEGPGEDPYLASCLGAAMVRGFQGKDLTHPERLAACAKHFAGYGAVEAGKDYNNTFIPEQLLRELHLPAFKACVDAGALTLMSAFTDLNGVPASGNELLLRKVLREEWGFEGFVVSDWASIWEMISHGFCETSRDAAEVAVKAGLNMEMATTCYQDELEKLVTDGKIEESTLDELVRQILRVKFACGLFENPYKDIHDRVLLAPEHREVARALATESAVLLKNDGTLPLSGASRLAVIGPLSASGIDHLGCWAYDGKAEDTVTALDALRERFGERLSFSPGLSSPRSTDQAGFAAAFDALSAADVGIVFVGEDWALSGEARCRAFIDLPGAQAELVEVLAAAGKPLVLVVMTGRPLTLGPLLRHASAVLWAWHPGTMGGPAIADLLTGAAVPSGKLPITIPRTVGQVPIYYAKKNGGRPPKSEEDQGIPLGSPLDPKDFSISHMDVETSPEFPFGFGLSYTTFEYRDLELSKQEITTSESLGVSFELANTGGVEATEVAQLYLRDLVATVTRPVRELKRFARVKLAPGERRRVTFELLAEDLAFVGPDMKRCVEPGRFQIFAGGSSRATLTAEFTLR
jgi:beta-glucosidase